MEKVNNRNTAEINYGLNFLILILAQAISNLGTRVSGFALSLFVLNKTGSSTIFATIIALTILPGVIVNIIAGVFVDRHDRKKIIVICDLAVGIIEVGFMFLFGLENNILMLVSIFVIILSIFQAFFQMALQASIPNIVSEEKVAVANSVFQSIGAVMAIVGPILGAVLYKGIGIEMVLLVDGISFIFAGICELLLKFKQNFEKIEEESSKSYLDSIKDSLNYLKTRQTICFFLTVAVVVNFVYNPLMFVVLPYVLNNILKVSSFQLSLTQAVVGLGVIVGAIVVSLQKSRIALMKKFFVLLAMQAILMILWIFPNLSWFSNSTKWTITSIFVILLFLYSMLNIIQNIPILTYFQLEIPEDMRGRIMSFVSIALGVTTPLGMFIYGLLLKIMNWGYLCVGTGVIIFLICVYCQRCKYFMNFLNEVKEETFDTGNVVEVE